MGRLPVEARHTPTMRVELREKVRFPTGSNDNSASAKSPSRSARQASRAWLLPPYFASPKNRVPPAKQPRGHTKLPPVHQSGEAFEFVRFSERHSRLSSVHSRSVSGTCRLTISTLVPHNQIQSLPLLDRGIHLERKLATQAPTEGGLTRWASGLCYVDTYPNPDSFSFV